MDSFIAQKKVVLHCTFRFGMTENEGHDLNIFFPQYHFLHAKHFFIRPKKIYVRFRFQAEKKNRYGRLE